MKRSIYACALLLFLLGAILPLLKPGFFSMHDDTQVARVISMSRALSDGQFPVRWVADLGYGFGYPIFNFYGPLPYYFAGIFVLMGVTPLVATKIMFGVGIILLFFTTYILVSIFWGKWAGLISGALALYAPYHAVQIYIRGAVGEFWASAFVPLVVLGFLWSAKADTRVKGIYIGAFGIAMVILSHTISGYVVVGASIFYSIGYFFWALYHHIHFRKMHIISYILLIIFGLGISAFFWFPALLEMKYTNVVGQVGGTANFRDHFVCLPQLWNSLWGFGGSQPGCIDGMSFKLGKIHLLIAAISFVMLLRTNKFKQKSLVYTGLTLLVVGIYLVLPISTWVWQIIPGFSYIQYPWRFLSFVMLGIAVIAGGIGAHSDRKIYHMGLIVIVVSIIGLNVKLFMPQYTTQQSDRDYQTLYELRYRASKVSDEYLPSGFIRPVGLSSIALDTIMPNGEATVSKIKDTATDAIYRVSSPKETIIRIQRASFPGWRYLVNQKEVNPTVIAGIPEIMTPKGVSIIEIRFIDTPVRTVGNIVSLITSIGLFYYYVRHKKIVT